MIESITAGITVQDQTHVNTTQVAVPQREAHPEAAKGKVNRSESARNQADESKLNDERPKHANPDGEGSIVDVLG